MTTTAIQRRVLVYGGKGALGSVCVDYFRKQNWVIIFFLFCQITLVDTFLFFFSKKVGNFHRFT